MTAGSGLLHIEAPPEWLVQQGGLFHGIQLWVNLPRDAKMNDPQYQDIRSGEVALLTSPDAGALVRVIAGSVDGHAGPGATYTPMALVHATVEPGARLELPWDVDFNALVYVLNGSGTVGAEGRPIHTGQSAVLGAGDYLTVTADGSQESRSPKLDVIVVGGRPIREPLAWAGPFVMNTKAEVLKAYEDFQQRPLRAHPRLRLAVEKRERQVVHSGKTVGTGCLDAEPTHRVAGWPGSTETHTASRTSGPPMCSTSPTGRAGPPRVTAPGSWSTSAVARPAPPPRCSARRSWPGTPGRGRPGSSTRPGGRSTGWARRPARSSRRTSTA